MKRNSKPASLREMMNVPGSTLKSILLHTESLKLFQRIVSQKIKPELAKHCQVANIRAETLTLSTDHANWATKLRYSTPELLRVLQSTPDIPFISTIRVITSPKTNLFNRAKKNKLSLSDKTSTELCEIAKTINDPEISICLERLSKHTKSESNY